jgi:hypothetical protein
MFAQAAIEMHVHATNQGCNTDHVRGWCAYNVGLNTPEVFIEAISLHDLTPFRGPSSSSQQLQQLGHC